MNIKSYFDNIISTTTIFLIYSQMVELLLSKTCAIKKVNHLWDYLGKNIFYKRENGLKFDIKNSDFTLDAESYSAIERNIKEYQKSNNESCAYVEFNWPSGKKETSSLTKHFNITAFIGLFKNFKFYSHVYLHNLHSIEIDLFDDHLAKSNIENIYLVNSDLRYKINGKIVKTCEDVILSGKISSLFQIPLINQRIILFGCRFPLTLCPLIFQNSSIKYFRIFDLIRTFYRTNLLKFSNDSFEKLNTNITNLFLNNCENINLDTFFLNPYVFRKLEYIYVNCFLTSIDVDLFATFKSLYGIFLPTFHFRKLIHQNGIEWIKRINRGLHVNLSNLTSFYNNFKERKFVLLNTLKGHHIEPMFRVFPEEDFCVYKDYPFEQMVFSFQYCYDCFSRGSFEYLKTLNPTYSCTYLWINQYFYLWRHIYPNHNVFMDNLLLLLNSDSYKNINSCDFERRIALCNRSEYHLKDIWGTQDYFILNKKIQIAVKILTYLVSLFCIATNIRVIKIIFAKHNKHVFKDFKHYTYLGLISVFSLLISVIEIFSWLSECFYPFEVFCLAVHKTVVAQLFKMVVKECLVITLRFLSNFCYIAFALCRIALIGRDHNKLIKFMSELTIWKYILCSLIFSLAFSWIKYFKYSINFGFGELNYPIWNERDIATPGAILPRILDFYMVFNVISDLLNYLVFVVLCFLVDVNMLVRLRSTVNESIERIKSMGSNDNKQFEKKKSELEETMKKSIRMVVVNTSIGLLLKLPLVFLPLVNTIAKFLFKVTDNRYNNLAFDRFFTQLFEGEFYSLIQDSTQLLYLISISIQFFIYKKFDKKFKGGTFSPPSLVNKNSQK